MSFTPIVSNKVLLGTYIDQQFEVPELKLFCISTYWIVCDLQVKTLPDGFNNIFAFLFVNFKGVNRVDFYTGILRLGNGYCCFYPDIIDFTIIWLYDKDIIDEDV